MPVLPEGFMGVIAVLVAIAVIANIFLQLRINIKKANQPERRGDSGLKQEIADIKQEMKRHRDETHDYMLEMKPDMIKDKLDKIINRLSTLGSNNNDFSF